MMNVKGKDMMPGDLLVLYHGMQNTHKIFSISLIISIDDDNMIELYFDVPVNSVRLWFGHQRFVYYNAELIRPKKIV